MMEMQLKDDNRISWIEHVDIKYKRGVCKIQVFKYMLVFLNKYFYCWSALIAAIIPLV